jgi:HSP20 family molecular chaperone IbpA
MSDFNSDDIRTTGHDSIKILSDTAHTFLDTLMTGIVNPERQPPRKNHGFAGDLQKMPDYYFSSNEHFFIYYILMPGVSKENSNVKISNGKLVVTGKTEFEQNTISNIFYNKSIKLPLDIYVSDITANSKDGIFTIKIPKKNENIDIRVN